MPSVRGETSDSRTDSIPLSHRRSSITAAGTLGGAAARIKYLSAALRRTHRQLPHFGRPVCLHDVPRRNTKPFAELRGKVAGARDPMVE